MMLQMFKQTDSSRAEASALAEDSKMRASTMLLALVVWMAIVLGTPTIGQTSTWADLSASDLKRKLDSGADIFLLNPLSDLEFNEANIPGSVNIPLHNIMSTSKLPKNKDTLIVTYCLGRK